jgi:hypothetical protein
MKKIVVFLALFAALGAAATTPPEVNEKVLKAFKEIFIKATDVVWHEMQNTYQASFKQSEISTRAFYDTEGNLLRTTRYYAEENLPVHILSKLKNKYSGKLIHGVTEITQENEVAYFVTLHDEKNWYVVKSDSYGSFELTKKYRKA